MLFCSFVARSKEHYASGAFNVRASADPRLFYPVVGGKQEMPITDTSEMYFRV